MKLRLALLAIVLFACKPAANPDENGPQPVFDHKAHHVTPPAEWTPCTKDTECVAVGVGCCYQMAVAAEHEIEAKKAIEKESLPGQCSTTCDPAPACVDHHCRIQSP